MHILFERFCQDHELHDEQATVSDREDAEGTKNGEKSPMFSQDSEISDPEELNDSFNSSHTEEESLNSSDTDEPVTINTPAVLAAHTVVNTCLLHVCK